ncbi:MAG: class I SAM-dependent methyltransferase [Actinobacteria bacterium]|nr:class I SAM-dependent methyltransferase [Actinomycetota bacterium]
MKSSTLATLAPGVPSDYYQAIADAEGHHWWHRGMLAISDALLGPRLNAGGRVLDAGCGTGGFLRFLTENGEFASVAGVDIASTAIELASRRLPEADLRVAPLNDLPFEAQSFELVVANDVLQHVPEGELPESLRELHRVLVPGGTLFVRTNGSRRHRRERDDWRAYDFESLSTALASAGFACERLTYANVVLSLVAAALGRSPVAPSAEGHGIPVGAGSPWKARLGLRLLRAEACWLSRPGRSLPYGHTLFAVAVRP